MGDQGLVKLMQDLDKRWEHILSLAMMDMQLNTVNQLALWIPEVYVSIPTLDVKTSVQVYIRSGLESRFAARKFPPIVSVNLVQSSRAGFHEFCVLLDRQGVLDVVLEHQRV